jgi:hypothetical protein
MAVRIAEEVSVLREPSTLLRCKDIVFLAVLCKNHAKSRKCTVAKYRFSDVNAYPANVEKRVSS